MSESSASRAQSIRSASKRLDSFHSASYFSAAVAQALAEAGLSPRNQYLAVRSAPLGAASPELVTATFYSFSPAFVAARVPACWDEAAPSEVCAARLAGVEAMCAELFSASAAGSADSLEELRAAAERVREALAPVLAAQDLSGRALYAGHSAALRPEAVRAHDGTLQVFLDLWADITLLREYRGDGHLASLISGGLTGLEAIVLDSATGRSFTPTAMRKSRGWSEEEWRATAEVLADRGLLTDGTDSADLAEEGLELKAAIEDLTDDSVAAAWEVLDDAALAALKTDAKALAVRVAESGTIPRKLFGHG
ncbi:SCO6745 family protein [Brevibacterium salitolerans]|uniref:SalK n=1 Tax=Brevibacterium salitolerans TaxID=1403566 RepID=A0ABP5ITD3_9MICO